MSLLILPCPSGKRGALVRKIAEAEHTDPFGRKVRISRWTLDRWIADWRRGGFDVPVPSPASLSRAPHQR